MAHRRLVSHLVISPKWLPKIFVQIVKEYLRAKLQAPVKKGLVSPGRKQEDMKVGSLCKIADTHRGVPYTFGLL